MVVFWFFFFRVVVFCLIWKLHLFYLQSLAQMVFLEYAVTIEWFVCSVVFMFKFMSKGIVSSIMLLWFGVNVEKMSNFLVCNKDICSPSGRCSMLSQLVMWLGNKIIAEWIDLMTGLKTPIRKLYFTEDKGIGKGLLILALFSHIVSSAERLLSKARGWVQEPTPCTKVWVQRFTSSNWICSVLLLLVRFEGIFIKALTKSPGYV